MNVSLAGGAQGLMVHLVIQARQDYLDIKDQEGTQVWKEMRVLKDHK